MNAHNDRALLSQLANHGVEFVIIGGVCGVLHGVPLVTLDLDICCPFSLSNLRRLQDAVKDLHPFHRMTAKRLPFEISEELASRLNNLYLQTDLGTLDCLSEVKGLGNYQDVFRNSISHRTSYGEFRMLDLDSLIAAKEAMGRERDRAAVKLLRAIKEKTKPL
jgi:hypothetical protein